METKNNVKNELLLTRVFNAPRSLVWEAWTDVKHVKKWWGPKHFTCPVCEWDVKEGSKFVIHMQAPDGVVYPMDGTFTTVKKPERIEFISNALDTEGRFLFELKNTVTFAEENGKTKLTLHVMASKITAAATPYLSGMDEGWNSSIDKLEKLITDFKNN